MAFSKDEMQEELTWFMEGFADSVVRMYRGVACPCEPDEPFVTVSLFLGSENTIKESWLWSVVNEMYDFGINGLPSLNLGQEYMGENFDYVEMFLHGLGSMELYLKQDGVDLPNLSLRAARTAVARHVLEGGRRHSAFAAAEYGLGSEDRGLLTLQEVALLADMDEGSVRNAASQKQPGALKTVTVGKRSLVEAGEARRWLSGRKGFIPTQKVAREAREPECKTFEIKLPIDTAGRLEAKAKEAGLSVAEFVELQLASK